MNPIFDLFNTSLIFWEIITFVILLFLLYRYVYPPIRDQIQRRQSEIEQAIDEAQKTRSEAREAPRRVPAPDREARARRARSWTRPASRARLPERAKREAREASASSSEPARDRARA